MFQIKPPDPSIIPNKNNSCHCFFTKLVQSIQFHISSKNKTY